MPYFKCTEWGNQCVKACDAADSTCQSACRSEHPCGAQDPVKPNATLSASASKSAGPSPTQSDTDEAENTGGLLSEDNSDNNNQGNTGAATAIGASFGTMALTLAGVVAFAFL